MSAEPVPLLIGRAKEREELERREERALRAVRHCQDRLEAAPTAERTRILAILHDHLPAAEYDFAESLIEGVV